MSSLSEKLHGLLTRFRSGEAVMEHEIEDALQAAFTHLMPSVEAVKADLLKTVADIVNNAETEISTLIAEVKAELHGGTCKKFVEPQGSSDGPAISTSSDVSSTDQTA